MHTFLSRFVIYIVSTQRKNGIMWGGLNKTQMAGSMALTVEATALPVRMYWKIRRGHETERD